MLEQRIGPLQLSRVMNEHAALYRTNTFSGNAKCECTKRVYYDMFIDLPDGRHYKGEW